MPSSPRYHQRRVRASRFHLHDLTASLRLSRDLQAVTSDKTPTNDETVETPRSGCNKLSWFPTMPDTSPKYLPRPKPFRGVPYTRSSLSNAPIPLGSPIHLHPCPPRVQTPRARGQRHQLSSTAPSASVSTSVSACNSAATSMSPSPTSPSSSAHSWTSNHSWTSTSASTSGSTPLYAPKPLYAHAPCPILAGDKRKRGPQTKTFDPNTIVPRSHDLKHPHHHALPAGKDIDPYGVPALGYRTPTYGPLPPLKR